MAKNDRRETRFSASKRDFLKKMALFSVYVGPVLRTFEMAEITGKPTGPPKKEKVEKTKGKAHLLGPTGNSEVA